MIKKITMAAIAAAMVVVFCAGTAFSQDMEAKEDVTITAITVSGAFEVPDDEILSVVTSKVGEPLSTAKLEEDLQRIFDLGYFSKDVKASLSEYEGGARVTFRVEENPVVADVRFEGNVSYTAEQLMEVMNTKKNKVLNANTLRMDIEAIEGKYSDGGYLASRVSDARPEADNGLTIVISEGVIEDIKVEFVKKDKDDPEQMETKESGKTKPYVVTREMKVKPGDVYNTNTIGKDLQRVYNLGFFEAVHTRVESGSELGKVVLVVEVEEADTGTVGFGAGYSSNTGITGFLSLSERNLKGKARRGDIKLEFGGKRKDYEIGYFEPWLDKKQTSIEVGVYSTSKENFNYFSGIVSPDYEEIRTGFTLTLGRPISNYTKVYVGFKTENINVESTVKRAWYDRLDGTSRSVTGTIRTDTRDDVFNPNTGRYDTASLEVNGGVLGGDFDYEKLTLDLRRFYPVRKNQVFGFRALVGLGKKNIPRFDYFDLGGVNTLRGYDEYQFGGTKMLLYNAEYRFKLSGNLSAVLFGDAGATWMDIGDFDLSPRDMPKSIGAGLRLKIPAFGIGPVRLDYAYAYSMKEAKLHFGFGHMF